MYKLLIDYYYTAEGFEDGYSVTDIEDLDSTTFLAAEEEAWTIVKTRFNPLNPVSTRYQYSASRAKVVHIDYENTLDLKAFYKGEQLRKKEESVRRALAEKAKQVQEARNKVAPKDQEDWDRYQELKEKFGST